MKTKVVISFAEDDQNMFRPANSKQQLVNMGSFQSMSSLFGIIVEDVSLMRDEVTSLFSFAQEC